MGNDARIRQKWKGKILSWISPLQTSHSKPVAKLAAEVTLGILSSGSLQLAEIARTLKEPTRLHHTLKRLSRMLGKHHLWEELEDQVLERLAPRVSEDMILAIDPGDLNRNGSVKSEHLSRVRDGSCGEIVCGYPLIQVVGRAVRKRETLPLLCRLYSYQEKGFVSENEQIISVMRQVSEAIEGKRLWVIDRGGDRIKLWEAWQKEKLDVLVRITEQRHWVRGGKKQSLKEILRQVPLKHKGKLRYGSEKEVRFALTKVTLPDYPEWPLTMIIVKHGKQAPMVLVSSRLARGRRQGEKLIQSYMDRWSCEEGYRFTKQGFSLEQVMARSYTTLRNLVALATVSWALLSENQHDSHELIRRGKRQKKRKKLKFPFYSLLKGWQSLFAEASEIFYKRFRQKVREVIETQLFHPALIPKL